jgi:hypothetical protein
MKPFPPLLPDGSRSFPRKHLAQGHGKWNHYCLRAINGEVRLWVNGESRVVRGNQRAPTQLRCEVTFVHMHAARSKASASSR